MLLSRSGPRDGLGRGPRQGASEGARVSQGLPVAVVRPAEGRGTSGRTPRPPSTEGRTTASRAEEAGHGRRVASLATRPIGGTATATVASIGAA